MSTFIVWWMFYALFTKIMSLLLLIIVIVVAAVLDCRNLLSIYYLHIMLMIILFVTYLILHTTLFTNPMLHLNIQLRTNEESKPMTSGILLNE